MKLNKQNHYLFFSISRLYAMLLCVYKRSGQVKSLKTGEADEVFNVTENKTNFITDFFFLKYYFDLELLQLYSREIFSENFLNFFSKTLWTVGLEDRSFGQIQSVLEITTLYSRKSFRDLLEHKSKVSQKSCCNGLFQVAVLNQGASWWNPWKRFHKSLKCIRLGLIFIKEVHEGVFKHLVLNFTINRDACKKDLRDRCLHAALKPFLVGLFRALF